VNRKPCPSFRMVPFSMTWNDPKPRFQDCTIVAEYLSCMKHRTVYLRQPSFSFYPPADYMQHSLQQRHYVFTLSIPLFILLSVVCQHWFPCRASYAGWCRQAFSCKNGVVCRMLLRGGAPNDQVRPLALYFVHHIVSCWYLPKTFDILHFRYIYTENKEIVHRFSFKAQLWTTE